MTGRGLHGVFLCLLLQLAGCSHYDSYVISTEVIGVVTQSSGFPSVTRNSRPYILAPHSRLFPGDIITTDEQSLVHISLQDGATLELGTRTRLLISDYTNLTGYSRCSASLSSGSMRVTSDQDTLTEFSIRTTVGDVRTISRGFWLGYDIKRSYLQAVSLSSDEIRVSNQDGETTLNSPLELTRILPGAAPGDTRQISESGLDELMARHARISH